jgi:hypothetical protein
VSDWLTFEGRVVRVTLGRATYTILPLPPDVAAALEASAARRVEGEIAEHPVNLALSRGPAADGPFLWTSRSLLARIGLAPGEPAEVRLRPASAEAVETPDDLAAALRARGLTASWEALAPGRRRGMIYRIESARTAATRSRRIAVMVDQIGSAT